MSTSELRALDKLGLSLERIMEECRKWRADPHEVIARALTDEMREQAETSGMTMKAQADLAWKLVDKAEPSKQAVKHSGDPNNPITVHFSSDDEKL